MLETGLTHGLYKHAAAIFNDIANLEVISKSTLVGGTALALQLNHRKSEDFDFMLWRTKKDERPSVEWNKIVSAFETLGTPENRIHVKENLFIADIESIAVMKLEVLTRRATFRDYYDIYCIFNRLNDVESAKRLFSAALKHAEYRISSKTLFALLGNSERIIEDRNFALLEPKYNVTAKEIEHYLRERIRQTR